MTAEGPFAPGAHTFPGGPGLRETPPIPTPTPRGMSSCCMRARARSLGATCPAPEPPQRQVRGKGVSPGDCPGRPRRSGVLVAGCPSLRAICTLLLE